MQQEHHYCDTCGKQMTFVNSDGKISLQGIEIFPSIKAHVLKGDINSTHSSQNHYFATGEFCSFDCLSARLQVWTTKIKHAM